MSLKGIEYFDDQLYNYNRRLLSLVGLWPYQKISIRVRYASIIITFISSSIVTQLYVLLTTELKLEPIMELLLIFLPTLSFSTAYFNLLFSSAKVKVIFDRMRNDWGKLAYNEEFIIMQTYAGVSKLYSQTIICLFYLCAVFIIVPSMVYFFLYLFSIIDKTKLILPVHSEIFLANNMCYFVILFLEVVTIIILCTVGVAHHSVFMSLLQHAYGLFIVVSTKIDRPFKKDEDKFDWPSSDTNNNHEGEFDWIVTVIKNWNNVIDYVEVIKLLYERIYLIDVLIGFLFMIIDFLYIFQMLHFFVTAGEALKICMYINSNLLMIYSYYSLGQKLINHSSIAYTTCCSIPFYTLSNKTNKLLLLLIMRSMRPCSISIRGTFVASYEFFTKVIQLSFSFATIFYNTR